MKTISAVTLGCLVLTGCMTASGLDARNQFRCTEDNGFQGCTSISQTFNNSVNGGRASRNDALYPNQAIRNMPYSGMPIRTPIQVMRIWMAPWEDRAGILHDQSFMYFPLNESRWQIEHNREAIINQYRPTIRLLGEDNQQAQTSKATNDQLPDLGLTPQNVAPSSGVNGDLMAPPNLIPAPVK